MIHQYKSEGFSKRAIARRLGVDRKTVTRRPSPAPGIAAYEFEVEALLPQKKRHGANQFQVADGFILHSHYLCGKQSMGLKITVSMTTVMEAAAKFAMQLNKPE